MTLSLVVDPADPTPPYEQLRRQIADLIAGGALSPGARLPPVRQLAGDLGLAVGTVARTYRELEQHHLVVSRRGGGTRVAAGGSVAPVRREALLTELTTAYVARARALGFDDEEIRQAVRRSGEVVPEG
ncbi:GntR family transcriptional regulator [Nocardioides sp.]|uniref:GntR family transcriptional regulator n=1 Tax=Nocardioides sp. TaxID=35761 RepID=UPI0027374637|nr:GntR family transcriptional regulator [Nocardioides sp.]MDP3891728.1 GntR family transcriptional regulator [Nocardioides sp.]